MTVSAAGSRFDTELQPDPELDEGPASSGKIALFALGIALVLGAVFYGLNNTSVHEAQTTPPRPSRRASRQPAAPPGMRDVTPRPNTAAGHDHGRGAEQSDRRRSPRRRAWTSSNGSSRSNENAAGSPAAFC